MRSAHHRGHSLFFYRIFPTIEKGIAELWKIAPEIRRTMDPNRSILGNMFQKRNISIENILSHLAHTVFRARKNRYIHEPKIILEPGWFEYHTLDVKFGWIDKTHDDFAHNRRGKAYIVYVDIHTSSIADISKEMQHLANTLYRARWEYAEESYAPLLVSNLNKPREIERQLALEDNGDTHALPPPNDSQRALPGKKPLALPPPDDNNE